VILSDIEQRIKAKIEVIGTPLKDWDINIYRGILTGYNEAFIIDKTKKEEILANCQTEEERQKTIEIIRPILRGRDIKRYGYEFADLYIITTFPSLKIDIESYPAVKQHLLSFGYDRLKQTGDKGARKKTNNKWFETQDSISYWEDFNSQVLAWQRITKENQFCLTEKGMVILDSMAFISGIEQYKYWLLALLNSKLIYAWVKWNVHEYGDTGFRLSNQYVEKIPIISPKDKEIEQKIITLFNEKQYLKIDNLIYVLYGLLEEEIAFIEKL